MKLTYYLFRPEVTSFEQALREKARTGDRPFVELPPWDGPAFPCRAFAQKTERKRPKWFSFIGNHFKVEDELLHSETSSFLLLLTVSERVFAVTLGFGFNALDRGRLEPNFGLKVALNKIDAQKVRTLDTRTLDQVAKQRRTHVNSGSALPTFGVNPDLDWVRMVSGQPLDASFGKSMSGTDGLCLNSETGLGDLALKCAELLDIFSRKDYKENFGFVDNVQPLKKGDPSIAALDAALTEALVAGEPNRFTVVDPEIVDYERLDHFKIWQGSDQDSYDELDADAIFNFFLKHPNTERECDHTFVLPVDANGEPLLPKYPLRKYLVFEQDLNQQTYVLSFGLWFRVDRDYAAEVNGAVRDIPTLEAKLQLPPIGKNEKEGDYNSRASAATGYALMDKKLVTLGKGTGKIEVCDLLTHEKHFICVKRGTKSAALSHLFDQGSVSAELTKSSEKYRAAIRDKARAAWGGSADEWETADGLTVVYAISTPRSGNLAEIIPFFSRVNLGQKKRQLELLGCGVALCKIEHATLAGAVV